MNRQHFLETELETFPGNEPDEIWFKATGISIESFQGKILFQIQFNFVVAAVVNFSFFFFSVSFRFALFCFALVFKVMKVGFIQTLGMAPRHWQVVQHLPKITTPIFFSLYHYHHYFFFFFLLFLLSLIFLFFSSSDFRRFKYSYSFPPSYFHHYHFPRNWLR